MTSEFCLYRRSCWPTWPQMMRTKISQKIWSNRFCRSQVTSLTMRWDGKLQISSCNLVFLTFQMVLVVLLGGALSAQHTSTTGPRFDTIRYSLSSINIWTHASCTRSSQVDSHPSKLLAQGCLTSAFEREQNSVLQVLLSKVFHLFANVKKGHWEKRLIKKWRKQKKIMYWAKIFRNEQKTN